VVAVSESFREKPYLLADLGKAICDNASLRIVEDWAPGFIDIFLAIASEATLRALTADPGPRKATNKYTIALRTATLPA